MSMFGDPLPLGTHILEAKLWGWKYPEVISETEQARNVCAGVRV